MPAALRLDGGAGRRGPGARASRRSCASRVAAHAVRDRGRPGGAAGRERRAAPAGATSTVRGTRTPRGRRSASDRRARGPAVRPGRPAPLVRATAAAGGADDEHVLVLVMHHIVSDGWSIGCWCGSCRRCTRRYREGRRGARCRSLPVQYADYRGLAADWLRGEVLDAAAVVLEGAAAGRARRWSCPPTGRGRAVQSTAERRVALAAAGGAAQAKLRALSRARGRRCSWCCWRRSRWCCARYTRTDGRGGRHADRGADAGTSSRA